MNLSAFKIILVNTASARQVIPRPYADGQKILPSGLVAHGKNLLARKLILLFDFS